MFKGLKDLRVDKVLVQLEQQVAKDDQELLVSKVYRVRKVLKEDKAL